jgi:hypothetical protein
MKSRAFVAWLVLRITRWISWVSFLAYSFAITLTADRSSYLDHFSRPLHSTEAWLFGLPMLAVTLGFLELMMREQAGIARPNYFHLMPPSPPHSN